MPSDSHEFIGRIYDLSIIGLHFETYDELAHHPDCKYAYDTNGWVSSLAQRVESLNLVGDMLWPKPMPKSFKEFPISRYEWLTVAKDVFLMRYVSVIDCALLLVNQVYRFGLKPKECTLARLRKCGLPKDVDDHLVQMLGEQEDLRQERNQRIHHGSERSFTDDATTFKMASLFNDKLHGMKGKDQFGRKINVQRSFKEGLVGLQREFNKSTRLLTTRLDGLYDLLGRELENHFGPLIANATHGLNANSKTKSST
jgi:Cthe_2314-like HEPN